MTLYKDQYPSPNSYNFGSQIKHTSPCQDPYWRGQPIRQGGMRGDIEHDENVDDEEE